MQAVASLDSLLAAQTLWHAGRHPATAREGEPTGHAALDLLLPQGGWPRRALTELLLPADGVVVAVCAYAAADASATATATARSLLCFMCVPLVDSMQGTGSGRT